MATSPPAGRLFIHFECKMPAQQRWIAKCSLQKIDFAFRIDHLVGLGQAANPSVKQPAGNMNETATLEACLIYEVRDGVRIRTGQ
jgi:hypothetical protein